MNQYEEAYSNFEFIGPVPIDFDAPAPENPLLGKWGKCIVDELCKLDVAEVNKKGTEKIGIIFNLDKHDEPGSHWVCGFVDYPNKSAYYFDSYAIEPPKQIETFMKWLTTQDSAMKLFYNGNRFQRGGSECGMYSMYFILRMLEGDDFQAFSRTKPPDSFMLDLRDWLFST